MPNMLYLPEVDSTNLYAKQHLAELPHLSVVFTGSQTAGRGRLGRDWVNAAGQGLYYTIILKEKMVQPATLPLLSSMAVQEAIRDYYGVETTVKWPNDLLIGGKKLVGILCEGVAQPCGFAIINGIGLNLAQPQSYFDAVNLPHGTSLALAGLPVEAERDIPALAARYTAYFEREMPTFAAQGFAPYLERYRAGCVNLGKPVTFDGGRGIAKDVDENGNLVVETDSGEQRVFTGEVSVKGIYGAV